MSEGENLTAQVFHDAKNKLENPVAGGKIIASNKNGITLDATGPLINFQTNDPFSGYKATFVSEASQKAMYFINEPQPEKSPERFKTNTIQNITAGINQEWKNLSSSPGKTTTLRYLMNNLRIDVDFGPYTPNIGISVKINIEARGAKFYHLDPLTPWHDLLNIERWLKEELADGYDVVCNTPQTFIRITSPSRQVELSVPGGFKSVKYDDLYYYMLEYFPEAERDKLARRWSQVFVRKMFYDEARADSLSGLANELPGVKQRVKHPISGAYDTLMQVVISLNDTAKWTREQIADWIETLDDVPVFTVKVEEKVEYSVVGKITHVVTIKRVRQGEADFEL